MLRVAEIFDQLRRMAQRREAEERRDRLVAERDADRRDALFDFGLGVLRPSCVDRSLCDQVCEPMVWPAAATCLRISG